MPQRMAVNSEHRSRGIPLSVVIEPDAQRPDQIATPGGVVLSQRTKQRRGERRSLWRRQQLQNCRGPDIRELGLATVVTDADAQRLFGLTVRPSEFCQPRLRRLADRERLRSTGRCKDLLPYPGSRRINGRHPVSDRREEQSLR